MIKKHSWKVEEKAEFLIRIGNLLQQGYTISEGIELFLKFEKEKLKPTLELILVQLRTGSSFSEALSVLKIAKNIVSFIYFSEQYGNLASGLIDGGNLLKKSQQNKERLQKVVRYPIFLCWLLSLFMFIMYQFLFPHFLQVFSSINVELPLLTRIMIVVIENSPYLIPFFLTIFLVFFLYYMFCFRNMDVLHKAVLLSKIPLIGNYHQVILTYFFATNLSYLIKSGIAIYDALTIFKNEANLGYISKVAENLIRKLAAGEQLQRVLINDTQFLKELAYIVEHGQSNGRLDVELDYYSRWLLIDLEEKFKRIFMILQPLLFLIIGLMILLMFASILLPTFSIINGL